MSPGEREARLTAACCHDLRAIGALVLVLHQGRYSVPGVPDRYVSHGLWQGFLEFKGPDTRVGKHQTQVIERLCRDRPSCAWVVRLQPSVQTPGRWQAIIENTKGDMLAQAGTATVLLQALAELTP